MSQDGSRRGKRSRGVNGHGDRECSEWCVLVHCRKKEAGCASPSKPVYDLCPDLTSPSIIFLFSMANTRPDVLIGNTAERAKQFCKCRFGSEHSCRPPLAFS
ncbi:hypothetical protein JMJ77_0008141 [Colletotrichum scovillei]|uniref:Uncharacterized protein n=1 Tax=Colletotrichum scovillei TaxID=1209932 RepID=A0A9P7UGL9_9PEZI|nr:hypothetical protein JMJ77_0008141 [Colletotrichum scovillei]KAG7075108.1 hypothetical protein JMJ76_0011570 [Colletotrichum scovillei]KAG7082402.1 hypothetical protein JMJ78_0004504 [Colletotrichum scovillei]